jgi:lipoprotein-releasing system ATP-binding protein
MDSPVLQASDVHRYLGTGEQRTHVLKGVSLDIGPRQYVSIVGASGSGKSTLLYLLGGLDRPTPFDPLDPARKLGHVAINGRDTTDLDDTGLARLRNQVCGFVFQFHYLLKDFTAAENIALPMLKLGQLSRREAFDRAVQLLDQLGLADKADRRSGKLSGGEQQRVAIARALANKPAVLLADEPTGNLDKHNAENVADILDSLAASGQAIVIVTHDPHLAARAHRRITMEDGRIINEQVRTTPLDVRTTPQDVRTTPQDVRTTPDAPRSQLSS